MFPARWERIEGKTSPKIHHSHDRPAIRLQYLAASRAKKVPAGHASGSDNSDTSNDEVPDLPRLKKSRHPALDVGHRIRLAAPVILVVVHVAHATPMRHRGWGLLFGLFGDHRFGG